MASEKQKKLSSFIKETHIQLRKDSRIYGPSEAWERHLTRTKVLKNYATAMQELATEHWDIERLEDNRAHCRNKWIRSQCYEYFYNKGREKFDKKEMDIRNKAITLENNIFSPSDSEIDIINKEINSENDISSPSDSIIEESLSNECEIHEERSQIRLLDVGSCYNPLGEEKMFRVTPIDLSPHSDNVFQCDFLNVKLGSKSIVTRDGKAVKQLKEESFDAVVFSLLLEYLPCPEQRYICCQKAYRLLKPRGILLIITPDSNHVGKNAKFMESWRLVMSRMGFMRIVYEKSRHLHCLGFRKCVDENVAVRWAQLRAIPENDTLLQANNKIYIPQDFQNLTDDEESCENVAYDADELMSLFDELPCVDDTSE